VPKPPRSRRQCGALRPRRSRARRCGHRRSACRAAPGAAARRAGTRQANEVGLQVARAVERPESRRSALGPTRSSTIGSSSPQRRARRTCPWRCVGEPPTQAKRATVMWRNSSGRAGRRGGHCSPRTAPSRAGHLTNDQLAARAASPTKRSAPSPGSSEAAAAPGARRSRPGRVEALYPPEGIFKPTQSFKKSSATRPAETTSSPVQVTRSPVCMSSPGCGVASTARGSDGRMRLARRARTRTARRRGRREGTAEGEAHARERRAECLGAAAGASRLLSPAWSRSSEPVVEIDARRPSELRASSGSKGAPTETAVRSLARPVSRRSEKTRPSSSRARNTPGPP